jgi:hypothetical protein
MREIESMKRRCATLEANLNSVKRLVLAQRGDIEVLKQSLLKQAAILKRMLTPIAQEQSNGQAADDHGHQTMEH